MQVSKQQLELDMEQQTGSKSGKEYSRLYIVTLLILLICRLYHEKRWVRQSTSWNHDCRRNINNLRYADETTLMAICEEIESFLIQEKEENEKVGLQLNIQKTKIMASSPITSWQTDKETGEIVTDYFWGLQNHFRL